MVDKNYRWGPSDLYYWYNLFEYEEIERDNEEISSLYYTYVCGTT